MKEILIDSVEKLTKFDLQSFEVTEDIDIQIKLKLVDQKIEYPINIFHKKKDLKSNLNIKVVLYGNSELKMPIEMKVVEGATGTSTNLRAIVYILSDKSKAQITPGLLIHEKEINSAGHAVIIKNIKDKDTVYIQSRGIEKNVAKEIIVGL